MPKRQNTVKVDSAEVQGEGSYVVLRRMSWARQNEAQRLLAEAAGGQLPSDASEMKLSGAFIQTNAEYTRQLLSESVVEWNWVDDDEKPMPLPSAAGQTLDLSTDEVQFILTHLRGKPADLKN